jgi:hypothetical protein
VFKRLRRNGHLEYQKAANSSAQTVTLEQQQQRGKSSSVHTEHKNCSKSAGCHLLRPQLLLGKLLAHHSNPL